MHSLVLFGALCAALRHEHKGVGDVPANAKWKLARARLSSLVAVHDFMREHEVGDAAVSVFLGSYFARDLTVYPPIRGFAANADKRREAKVSVYLQLKEITARWLQPGHQLEGVAYRIEKQLDRAAMEALAEILLPLQNLAPDDFELLWKNVMATAPEYDAPSTENPAHLEEAKAAERAQATHRHRVWTVSLPGRAGSGQALLGMDVLLEDVHHPYDLLIKTVLPEGMIRDYNEQMLQRYFAGDDAAPDQRVMPGDRIIEVNGVQGSNELLLETVRSVEAAGGPVKLKVERVKTQTPEQKKKAAEVTKILRSVNVYMHQKGCSDADSPALTMLLGSFFGRDRKTQPSVHPEESYRTEHGCYEYEVCCKFDVAREEYMKKMKSGKYHECVLANDDTRTISATYPCALHNKPGKTNGRYKPKDNCNAVERVVKSDPAAEIRRTLSKYLASYILKWHNPKHSLYKIGTLLMQQLRGEDLQELALILAPIQDLSEWEFTPLWRTFVMEQPSVSVPAEYVAHLTPDNVAGFEGFNELLDPDIAEFTAGARAARKLARARGLPNVDVLALPYHPSTEQALTVQPGGGTDIADIAGEDSAMSVLESEAEVSGDAEIVPAKSPRAEEPRLVVGEASEPGLERPPSPLRAEPGAVQAEE